MDLAELYGIRREKENALRCLNEAVALNSSNKKVKIRVGISGFTEFYK